MDIEAEPRPIAGGCPLKHLQVTVRVAERGDGPSANMHLDADRLALPVIDEVDFGETNQHRLPVPHLELGPNARANDLLGRDAINPLAENTHELYAARGDDKRLEAVFTTIREHSQHGLGSHPGA